MRMIISMSAAQRMRPRAALLSLLVLLSMLLPIPALAGDAAEAAARRAQEKHGGRVLKVERRGPDYRVKILKPSGKVKVVTVPGKDAAEGRPGADAPKRKQR